jgi:hypothetical protein
MDEERLSRIEAEVKRLADEVANMKRELASFRKQGGGIPDFVAARGVLFKRGADGQLEPDAYCPKCKMPMWIFHDSFPPECSSCKYKAPFKGDEIPGIIANLDKGP